MSRELFHRELLELQDATVALGSMAEKALLDAMEALRSGDTPLAERTIENDLEINRRRFEIEERTMFVIGSQQPMAVDLRALASVLYIIVDLERIADHAEGIAKISLMLGEGPLPRRLGYIPAMADRAVSMLRDALKAYVDQDVELARRVCEADDEVDRLQDTVYDDCVTSMIADSSAIQHYTHLLWTAHNLERIADRCTNISERVVYMATGTMEEINVSKY